MANKNQVSVSVAGGGTKSKVAVKATKTCPDCQGTGLQGDALCPTCEGHGKI